MHTEPGLRPADNDQGFDITVRVYYEDTDAAGVVYYANYLRFCERARTEWLRSLGFAQHNLLQEQGIAFVVRSVQADYLAPARLDDVLTVEAQVVDIGPARLVFAQRVLRAEDVLFNSRVTIACVDTARNRPTRIPAAIRSALPAFSDSR
ncbi:MAG TPA: tol-pal system-associated acyl-CoA thioesterase [Azoarcus sp.]|nr:tol-pal system-associated acyl-CoA thioesterase [Azoarcus sp.]